MGAAIGSATGDDPDYPMFYCNLACAYGETGYGEQRTKNGTAPRSASVVSGNLL